MDKRFSGVGICAYQVATVNMLREAGLRPDFVIGHSLGETAAGYASGHQTERETILIQLTRSKMIRMIRPGHHCLRTRRDLEGLELMVRSGDYNHYYIFDVDDYRQKYLVSDAAVAAHESKETEALYDMNGQMSVVGMDAASLHAAIQELGLRQTCVACENSPEGQTVSGAACEVRHLREHLEGKNDKLFWRDIDTDGVAIGKLAR